MESQAKKPASAYDYYKKLVRDFDALEDELKASCAQQHELQATFLAAKAAKSDAEQRQRQRETKKWEADRDRQLEEIVSREKTVTQLSRQADELVERELRLQAELDVLHERQEVGRMTEAVRLRRLIHDKASLLDKELVKGQEDLDAIAQLIGGAPNNRDRSPVRTLVQNVHERRRSEFEAANRRFLDQVAAFGREQEMMKRKADEIRSRKQRALQILTSNQQEAVKDFFASSVEASEASTAPTSEVIERHARSLDFDAVLDWIDPIAKPESDEEADCRMEKVLEQARATVEGGIDRVTGVEKTIAERQQQAETLDVVLHTTALAELYRRTLLSIPWTADSCPPELRQVVFLARDLLLQCADSVVDSVESRRPDVDAMAQALLSDTLKEVIDNTAAELLVELRPRGTTGKVRSAVGSAFRSVFHRGNRPAKAAASSPKKPTQTHK